jgi:two-component system cell cycle sensor histidine kinase/response regulator CckA
VLEMLGQLLGARITVEAALGSQLRMVSADPTQLEQVLLNLAVNARDAMPDGGTLRFETDLLDLTGQDSLQDGQYVRIRVSDTGLGMSAEVRARVFEPFFTTKEIGKGTGLGLSTAYGILQEHGGDIRLRSSLGRGTTFSLLLPATDAMAPAAATAPEPPPALVTATASGHAILVVEDEVLVRGMISEGLSRLGHTVVTAASLKDARAHMIAHPPFDLMICDVVLPDGLGYALLSPQAAPALMISGHSREQLASQSTSYLPAAPHLHKPFSLQQLSEAVGSLLGRADRAES